MIISDLFRCPISKEPLFQTKDEISTEGGEYVYHFVDEVPDFYVEDEISATPPYNANRRWLAADAPASWSFWGPRGDNATKLVGNVASEGESEPDKDRICPDRHSRLEIDGASEINILARIYVPLSKPVLATVGLWTAVAHWNHWFDAMLYITNDENQVLQTFLQRIVIESSIEMIEQGLVDPSVTQFTPETIKAATVVVTVLPMLLIYPFVQKYFVKGIMLGGVKE